MYIGDISEKGLHHLVYEVVDNSIDEALAGYCDHIEVTINEDNSITVQDNGRGIPVDYHEKEKKSALEVVMTVLHAGGKFDKGSYKVSGGLHGVGVSCVNALSKHMTTQVFRNGKIFQQEYSCGHPLYSVKEVGMAEISGTKQTFWPDESIFTVTEYKYDILEARMRELAYLNKGITISLTDRRQKDEEGNFKKLYAVDWVYPWISHFLFSFLPTMIITKYGENMVDLMKQYLPMDGYWMKALFTVGALLPCVGTCHLVETNCLQKQLTSFHSFVGFTLAKSLGLNLVSSAVVSLIFAVIYYELEVIKSMKAAPAGAVDLDDDEEDI